jgi:hypothetical protein
MKLTTVLAAIAIATAHPDPPNLREIDCAVGALRVISDCHFRKAGTEYDSKPGIKWLSCTEK